MVIDGGDFADVDERGDSVDNERGAGDTGLLMIRRSSWPAFMCLATGLFALGLGFSLWLAFIEGSVSSLLEFGANFLVMSALQGTGAIMVSWMTIISAEVLKMNGIIASEEIIKFLRLDKVRARQLRQRQEEAEARAQKNVNARNAERQAQMDACEAERQAQMDAREAERQAQLDAREAELDRREAALMERGG